MYKHHRYPYIIIQQAVYFKFRFSLSYRDIEELMVIRGVKVDHSKIQRWVFKFSKGIEKNMNIRKKLVIDSWRLDETYIKVAGKDRYLYRAVDKQGNTIDFLLTKRRMKGSSQKFLNKAIGNNGKPRIINIYKSGANTAGIRTWNKRNLTSKKIKIRRVKYLNNVVE
ncbi:IS6 family transposase [uncultured Dokdonia sp.]|uniref:IS6 family transposase n=1 Tax=uncultured Dokdonia sp. TaxID=575653 RepID=UPI00261E41D5|nr:IS6 family transposase [uncultured Dokdonia sp.]